VSVSVADNVSGLADGAIELSREGSGTWQALHTEKSSDRLVARVDDAALPAGRYLVRAHARDQAGNESSTSQPLALTLPLRIASTMTAGIAQTKIVRRTVRRDGKRRRIRRPVTVLKPSGPVAFGRRVDIRGRLANRDGRAVAGASIQVFSRSVTSAEQLVGVVQTNAEGRFSYRASGTMSRTLRLAYGGSPLILPAQRQVRLRVPAAGSLRVSRRRVLNGQTVRFSGSVRAQPLPPGGKLVALQVRLSGRWQTFRTTRTDSAGRWSIPYRFKRTRGVQRYRFRLGLPPEAGYPFAAGASRSLVVRVRGQ
jgi:5-hydroxyisourate hydrolase-like protein (transthyretin family)